MKIDVQQILSILGEKEVELSILRKQCETQCRIIADLQTQLKNGKEPTAQPATAPGGTQ